MHGFLSMYMYVYMYSYIHQCFIKLCDILDHSYSSQSPVVGLMVWSWVRINSWFQSLSHPNHCKYWHLRYKFKQVMSNGWVRDPLFIIWCCLITMAIAWVSKKCLIVSRHGRTTKVWCRNQPNKTKLWCISHYFRVVHKSQDRVFQL